MSHALKLVIMLNTSLPVVHDPKDDISSSSNFGFVLYVCPTLESDKILKHPYSIVSVKAILSTNHEDIDFCVLSFN